MKEFLRIMGKDIMDEHFTRKEYIVYGIFAIAGRAFEFPNLISDF